MTEIYVDADACPVKREVYRVARRYGLKVHVVANTSMGVPPDGDVEMVTVGGGFGAADDWIAGRAGEGDIVITNDIPLADRVVKQSASVLTPKGRRLTEDSICDALATRDLMEQLREGGMVTGGPAPFAEKDRSRFLSRLDELIHAVRRGR